MGAHRDGGEQETRHRTDEHACFQTWHCDLLSTSLQNFRVVDDLRKDGQVHRAQLGVSIQPVTPELADSLDLKDARGAIVSD